MYKNYSKLRILLKRKSEGFQYVSTKDINKSITKASLNIFQQIYELYKLLNKLALQAVK